MTAPAPAGLLRARSAWGWLWRTAVMTALGGLVAAAPWVILVVLSTVLLGVDVVAMLARLITAREAGNNFAGAAIWLGAVLVSPAIAVAAVLGAPLGPAALAGARRRLLFLAGAAIAAVAAWPAVAALTLIPDGFAEVPGPFFPVLGAAYALLAWPLLTLLLIPGTMGLRALGDLLRRGGSRRRGAPLREPHPRGSGSDR